jgi:hypothetical protein
MAHQTGTLTQPIPMPRHTHLTRRGSRYYLNVKVPKEFRRMLKKELIRKSPKTSDPHEAARMVRFESLQLGAVFDWERAKLRGADVPSKQIRSISRQEAHDLVFRWFIVIHHADFPLVEIQIFATPGNGTAGVSTHVGE